ncbi:hypothetical protein SCA6_005988 [Theobroma cacao]
MKIFHDTDLALSTFVTLPIVVVPSLQMKGASTHRSFGNIHKDVEMGTKESYWIYGYFGKWRFLITLRRLLSLCKCQGKDEEFKFVIYLIIALVHLGAHE